MDSGFQKFMWEFCFFFLHLRCFYSYLQTVPAIICAHARIRQTSEMYFYTVSLYVLYCSSWFTVYGLFSCAGYQPVWQTWARTAQISNINDGYITRRCASSMNLVLCTFALCVWLTGTHKWNKAMGCVRLWQNVCMRGKKKPVLI